MKTRAARRFRTALPALLALAGGCAHHHEDPTTSTYVWGTIFLLIGVALGIAVIMSLNEG